MSLRKLITLNRRESLKQIGFISGGLLAGRFLRKSNAAATPSEAINADEYISLQAAVSAIGSARRTLSLSTAKTVSANLTIPDNVHLLCVDDGLIVPDSGVMVTIQGTLTAPQRPIFAGSGTISFAGNTGITEIYPEWWSGTDAQKINAAIKAAINVFNFGIAVWLSPRTYNINATIEIKNCYGLKLLGAGWAATTLQWTGDATGPIVKMSDVHGAEIGDFRIVATSAHPVATAMKSFNETGVNIAPPGHIYFRRIRMELGAATSKGFQFGGEGDQGNNDFHILEQIQVIDPIDASFSIENAPNIASSQVSSIMFKQCIAALGKYGLTNALSPQDNRGGGSFFWEGGEIAGATIADFYLSYVSAPCYVKGYTSEGGKMLLKTINIAGAALGITFEQCRVGYLADISDGATVIDVSCIGSVTIRDSYFIAPLSGLDARSFRFQWNPGGQVGGEDDGRSFTVENCFFQMKRINGQLPTMQTVFNTGGTLKRPTRWSGNIYQGDPAIGDMFPRVILPHQWFEGQTVVQRSVKVEAYISPYTPDPSRFQTVSMALENTTSFTINAPINAKPGYVWRFFFSCTNNVTITWATGAGGFVKNTSSFAAGSHTISFEYDGVYWYQIAKEVGLF